MRRCVAAIQATRPLLKTMRREFPQVPAPQRLKRILSRRKVDILAARLGAAAPYRKRASDCCGAQIMGYQPPAIASEGSYRWRP